MTRTDKTIDHVTLAHSDLSVLRSCLASIGLPSIAGGTHSNGVTHMALVPFEDGSYLELISTLEPGATSPWWDAAIRTYAGACAWSLRASDLESETERLRELGVQVSGPKRMSRETPAGPRATWSLTFLGGGEPGSRLPFLIEDETPRAIRVPNPQPDVLAAGVSRVIVAIDDLDAASEEHERVFGLRPVRVSESDFLDARILTFEDAPYALAIPRSVDSWLAQRVRELGSGPCAFVFEARRDALQHLPVVCTESCRDERVHWLHPDRIAGARIAFVVCEGDDGGVRLPE